MQSSSFTKFGQLLLLALVCCHLATGSPVYQEDDTIDVSLSHLSGQQCGPDEKLFAGRDPSCEPTCDNKNPVCIRMLTYIVDYVPCFCDSTRGLVRDTTTKRCVRKEDCPKKM